MSAEARVRMTLSLFLVLPLCLGGLVVFAQHVPDVAELIQERGMLEEEVEFLKWAAGGVITAMAAAIGVLWRQLQKLNKDRIEELNKAMERNSQELKKLYDALLTKGPE